MVEEFAFDVFLSHSSKDKPVVRDIAERLKADGLHVWFDEWQIKPGDNIPSKIEEGLEKSRVLVLCMSANAFGSDWAQLEAGTFRFRDPVNKERRFIPLRLDDERIKGSLGQFHYIDWRLDKRENEYSKLLAACRLYDDVATLSLGNQSESSQPQENYRRITKMFESPLLFWIFGGIFAALSTFCFRHAYDLQNKNAATSQPQKVIAEERHNAQLATFGDHSPITYIEKQNNDTASKSSEPMPSVDEITKLGRRALWSNEYGGDRRSYSILLKWKENIKDAVIDSLLSTEIDRIEGEYAANIMALHIQKFQCICKIADPPCSKGFEVLNGFLASNMLDHLAPNKRWDERMKAAYFLSNLKTSPDKDAINKEELYNRLIMVMKEDPSLGVSKMAFETYKILAGFSSPKVFDFEGAVTDWEKRKTEILKKKF